MPSPRKDLPTLNRVRQRRTIILYHPDHTADAAACVEAMGYEDARLLPTPALETAPIGRHTGAEALVQVGEIKLHEVTEKGLLKLRSAFEATQPTPATEVAIENIDFYIREKQRLEGAYA